MAHWLSRCKLDFYYTCKQPTKETCPLRSSDVVCSWIAESRAIMRYICDKYSTQGTPLYGKTPIDRALVEQWLEIESQECTGPMLDIVTQVFFGPTLFHKPTDAEAVAAAREKLSKILDIYEKQLSKHKYLAGDFVSLADVSHLPVANYCFNMAMQQDLLCSRKHVAAWWEDISNRDSWKKVMEKASPHVEEWKASKKWEWFETINWQQHMQDLYLHLWSASHCKTNDSILPDTGLPKYVCRDAHSSRPG